MVSVASVVLGQDLHLGQEVEEVSRVFGENLERKHHHHHHVILPAPVKSFYLEFLGAGQ